MAPFGSFSGNAHLFVSAGKPGGSRKKYAVESIFLKKRPYRHAATRFFLPNWALHFENGHFLKMEKWVNV